MKNDNWVLNTIVTVFFAILFIVVLNAIHPEPKERPTPMQQGIQTLILSPGYEEKMLHPEDGGFNEIFNLLKSQPTVHIDFEDKDITGITHARESVFVLGGAYQRLCSWSDLLNWVKDYESPNK